MRWFAGAVLAMAVAGAGNAFGQAAAGGASSKGGDTGVLVIQDQDPDAVKGVRLSALDTLIRVDGPVAEVNTTLVFENTLDRQLEGELEFPLPDGAVLSGYALDVPAGSGELVEGVPVPKEKARRILEAEERVKADPGLIEQTVGNNFKTRIYPIPAHGTRTVRVTWVTAVTVAPTETLCTIANPPMGKPDHGTIRVEVAGDEDPATVKVDGLEGVAFSVENHVVAGEKTALNGALPERLVIHRALTGSLARVESFDPPASVDDGGNVVTPTREGYFVLSVPVREADTALSHAPQRTQRLAVLWDTSLSGAKVNHDGEIAVLEKILQTDGDVSVVLQTTNGAAAREFGIHNGDASALVAAIRGLTYDGALQIDSLEPPQLNRQTDPNVEQVLFFSDGLITLGKPAFSNRWMEAHLPIMTISAAAEADHALLRRLAENSGGVYVDLQQSSADTAAAALMAPGVTASLSGEGLSDIYPKVARVVPGRQVVFVGKSSADGAKATVQWSTGAPVGLTLPATEPGNGALARYWAGQRVEELAADPLANDDALSAVARKFNIVTPNTSLLVLETADQYVKYQVVPPASRKDIYADVLTKMKDAAVAGKKVEGEKIDRVLALWQTREEWWDKTYTYPADFKYVPPKDNDRVNGAGGGFGNGGGARFEQSRRMANAEQLPSPAPSGQSLGGQAASPAAPMAGGQAHAMDQTAPLDAGRQSAGESGTPVESIAVKPWDPDTPYLRAMKRATDPYAAYLHERPQYLDTPSFYLDAANCLLSAGKREQAIRVLTNIAQLKLEDAPLLRVAAYRLMQIGAYDLAIDLFQKARALRPDEPQSDRDLAQALAWRGLDPHTLQNNPPIVAYNDLHRSLDLYKNVVMNQWERFPEIETVALMESNSLWAHIQSNAAAASAPVGPALHNPLDPRLIKNLDCDLRIAMTWDADDTDIDLHVIEPSGEEAMYDHNRTTIGGMVSRDFTQGYGPEEYCLRHAMKGVYTVNAVYYGTRSQKVLAPVTVQATIFTNFGRPNEQRETLTLRLTDQKETQEVGKVTVK